MNLYLRIILPIAGFSFLLSCCPAGEESKPESKETHSPNTGGLLVADTIIYDVLINNPDPEDTWADECLKYLNHSILVDSLFGLVYSGRIIAYDFFTQERLKISDIKDIESVPEFSRKQIGKIQFSEKWSLDPVNQLFNKEIISIVLGYELYDDSGNVRGYKPVFKLFLN
jgi:hypothetical protein